LKPQPGYVRPVPKNYSDNSYADNKHGYNPGKEKGFDGVLYKL